jgi:hypothetical protein
MIDDQQPFHAGFLQGAAMAHLPVEKFTSPMMPLRACGVICASAGPEKRPLTFRAILPRNKKTIRAEHDNQPA